MLLERTRAAFLFFLREVNVPGALGKAVFLAYDRHQAEFHIHEKIFDHALEDLCLLRILEAVVSAVAFGQVEELGAGPLRRP